jgi:hypothetical protein
VLDFDHRPGTKKLFGVATGFRFGVQTLLDEIAKCDVVCANCHRMRHVRRKGAPGPPPAGTGWWFQPDYEI